MAATTCNTGTTSLVDVVIVDFFDNEEQYRKAIPSELSLRKLRFTEWAPELIRQLSPRALIVQGMSKYDETVPFETFQNTFAFVRRMLRDGFEGPIFIVSNMLADSASAYFVTQLASNQVRVMGKWDFFDQANTLLEPLTNLGRIWAELENHWDDELAEGPLEILEELAECEDAFQKIGPHRLINDLGGYLLRGDSCNCWTDIIPLERWLHQHHDLVDGAYRDLLVRYGLLDQLILELELDLASPDQFLGDDEPFGRDLRKSYGQWCLRFLQGV